MMETNRPEPETATSAPGVRRRLALAWLALAWERLWVRLWLPVTLVGLFLAIALTDSLAVLPAIPQVGVVVLAAAGIAFLAIQRLRSFVLPSRGEARARLESRSPVEHRPLTTVEDSFTGGDAVQNSIWALHQRRAREELTRLRAAAPAPGVAALDRFAVRAAVLLALFVALLGGSGTIPARLWRNVIPAAVRGGPPVGIKMWITPPEYTGRSPAYVEIPATEGRDVPSTLEIAAGSSALLVITGTEQNVSVAMDKNIEPLERLADASQHGEVQLKQAKRLELRQGAGGKVIAGFDVDWIPDNPPAISITAPPSELTRWRLKVDYKASDDYGVSDIAAHIVRAGDKGAKPQAVDVPVTLPPFASKTLNQPAVLDLASHPWAGLKVKLSLQATDQAGQSTMSEAVETVLPERTFNHPVAKELAKQRKDLLADAAAHAEPALKSVTQVTKNPASFGGDPLVHLALATARFRLSDEPIAKAMETVPDLLWHAAVRIEDGNLTVAEQKLAEAEKALREAIDKGASPEEINKRLNDLQQALNDYQKAKAEKQENSFAANQGTPPDIKKMMDQMRQMNEAGAKEGVKQQLAQLQQKLQEMRDQSADPNNQNQQAAAAQKLMKDMQNLSKAQADMLNKNFERARQEDARNKQRAGQQDRRANQPPDTSMQGGADAAAAQEAVRKELSRITDSLKQMTGKAPDGLAQANDAMAEARDDLRVGAWQSGVEAQGKALSKLEESSQQAQQDMMEAMFKQGMGGIMDQPGPNNFHFGQGQRGRSGGNNSDLEVPTGPDPESMASRVRTILEEIRSRAADRTRPSEEQDYLKRLMKQF